MAEAVVSPAKKAPKKPAVKPAHPSYAITIKETIKALKERGGSSSQTMAEAAAAPTKKPAVKPANPPYRIMIADAIKAKKIRKPETKRPTRKKTTKRHPRGWKVYATTPANKPTAKKPAAKNVKKTKKPAIKKEIHLMHSGKQLRNQERWPPKIQQLRKPPDRHSHHCPEGRLKTPQPRLTQPQHRKPPDSSNMQSSRSPYHRRQKPWH